MKTTIVNSPTEINGIKVIQDYAEIKKQLEKGNLVYHWELGDSLYPLIRSGEYCLIKPIKPSEVKRGDIVFCSVYGGYMVHQVWEISYGSSLDVPWFKIGDSHSSIFGWTIEVFGIAKGTNIFEGTV